ncbi:transcriptional regulator [Salmonella enterica]|nr:transcriptional regulator [Salmonella enterica]
MEYKVQETDIFSLDRLERILKSNTLKPGKVSESFFWLLIELSPLRSEKVIRSLRDFLVFGYTRREVCEKYSVSHGYFSVALKRVLHIDNVVKQLMSHY